MSEDDAPGRSHVADSFTMDCPRCGPDTIQFLDGEMVPHGCDYEPPAIVIDCAGDELSDPPAARS